MKIKQYLRDSLTIKLTMLSLLLAAAGVLTEVQALLCQTKGYTWNFHSGRDEVLYDIPSAEACMSLCFESLDCTGYTWISDDQVVDTRYYLFHDLDDIHPCYKCYSGTVPKQTNDAHLDGASEMAVVVTDTGTDCFQACADVEGCLGYTWYDQASQFPNSCYLYSSKGSFTGSCKGCTSGILNCLDDSPPPPVPDQCTTYQVLDDPTRNMNHGEDYNCDADWHATSPDWRGEGYYRIQEPAGVRIPTGGVSYKHCGTAGAGWINDDEEKIPNMAIGEEVSVKVNYKWIHHEEESVITVTKCPGDYFVYYLVNHNICNMRYCATF